MNNVITLLLTLITLSGTAYAAPTRQPLLKVNQYYVVYTFPIVPYMDGHGSLVVTAQPFAHLLGLKCSESDNGKRVQINTSGTQLVFRDGSNKVVINGAHVAIPFPARLLRPSYQMLVPVSVFVHAFHLTGKWNTQWNVLTLHTSNGKLPVDNSDWASGIATGENPEPRQSACVVTSVHFYQGVPPQVPADSEAQRLEAATENAFLVVKVKNVSSETIPAEDAHINLNCMAFPIGAVFPTGPPLFPPDLNVPDPPMEAGETRSIMVVIQKAGQIRSPPGPRPIVVWAPPQPFVLVRLAITQQK